MKSPHLARPARATRPHYPAFVTVWRWRIVDADAPVPVYRTLQVGNGVLKALKQNAWTIRGSAELPVCLHGPDRPRETEWKHEHAFLLPEDTDGDGTLDHISVFASVGLDPDALRLLVATDRVTLPDGNCLVLMAEQMGCSGAAGFVGPARQWRSVTPYLAPNNRPSFNEKDALKQLRYEIKLRQLGVELVTPVEKVAAIASGGADLEPEGFDLSTDAAHAAPQGSRPRFYRLTFAAPVVGPLAFGWSCHSGMGQFVPEL